MHKLPLEGIRVADFSQVFAGPVATLWLAVMGAEVIKIENPARPDSLRRMAKGKDGKLAYSNDPRIAMFPAMNASKKSCTLDLKNLKAQDMARRIIAVSDVVVENFATGVMDRFGLGYQSVKKVKPDIVMLSVSGFGRTGPYKDYLAYATVGTAFGGLNALTGYEGGQPQLHGGAWGDLVPAKAGAFMVLAGLEHRYRTGRGFYADLAMTEVIMGLMPHALLDFSMNGTSERNQMPAGNQDDIMAPHNVYPCRDTDTWAVVAVSNDNEWAALCDAIGKSEWKNDERFADQYSRWVHRAEIDPAIAAWTSQYTNQDVMEKLQLVGVPAARSSTLVQLATDPHLSARDRYVELPDYRVGKVAVFRPPGTTADNSVCAPAPGLGEHNDYVFKDLLGMTGGEVQALEEEGAIVRF